MKPALALAFAAASLAAQPAAALEECLIEPWKMVELGARSTGVLDTMRIDRGDEVEKGQVVATLHSEIEQASLALAKARADSDVLIDLAAARADYEDVASVRNETLFRRKVISDQQIQEARATHQISKLQVAQAQDEKMIAQLEHRRAEAIADLRVVRSPVAGVVVSTARTEGEYLDNGDHVATIAVIDPLRAEAFLPLDRLPALREGARVKVYPQEPVGGELEGVIDVVDRIVDARSGTIGVRVRVENPEGRTLAGLRCQLDLAPK